MDGMRETAPLLASALLEQPAVVGGARDWSWREVHAAAAELAAQLEPGGSVCNLCDSRLGFLVTWLAALRRGCLLLLPPSGGQADLGALLRGVPAATVVVDDDDWPAAAGALPVRHIVWRAQPPGLPASPAELAWTPDWDRVCARLHTSGSTGAPQPQDKTLRQLVLGARALAARLDRAVAGGLAACRAIVCSVPPQHMFGFETSVMLSLVAGLPVLERRPLLPLDVRAALQQCGGRAAWVATPLHLRALAQAGEALPDCAFALISTMPLAAAVAAQAEPLLGAPVIEIFGSTETGAMATRRTAREPHWQPLGDVRLEPHGDGTRAWGAHFPSPYALPDQVELAPDGRFRLLGRHADMLKIGGRRASLAGLNLLLQDLPGLRDGVFYLPATQAPAERLVLVHAGALDRAAAEHWLRERIDAVFLPRAWIEVERLPRDANGKLPRAALDAVYAAHRAAAAFEFRVAATHPALPGHFPGRPVVPGVLLLDHVLQRLHAATGRTAAGLPRVRFSAPLQPGEAARVSFEPGRAALAFRVTTLRDGREQAVAEGTIELAPEAAA